MTYKPHFGCHCHSSEGITSIDPRLVSHISTLPHHNQSSFGFKNFFRTFKFFASETSPSLAFFVHVALLDSSISTILDLCRRFANFFATVPTNDWYLKHKQCAIISRKLTVPKLENCSSFQLLILPCYSFCLATNTTLKRKNQNKRVVNITVSSPFCGLHHYCSITLPIWQLNSEPC